MWLIFFVNTRNVLKGIKRTIEAYRCLGVEILELQVLCLVHPPYELLLGTHLEDRLEISDIKVLTIVCYIFNSTKFTCVVA